ncbi:Uncharacterized protein MLTONO_3313 [Mesorhizobium loti]|nr:Uncharacterized protein MLTONO_3313 [Mesorhizobium loti]
MGAPRLDMRETRPPDQRAIAKHPKIAHIAAPDCKKNGTTAPEPVFFPSVPGYLFANVYLVVGIEGPSTNIHALMRAKA